MTEKHPQRVAAALYKVLSSFVLQAENAISKSGQH
jgi:hypothetical protein